MKNNPAGTDPSITHQGLATPVIVKRKRTKLTPEQVLDIWTGERSQLDYAAAYGVSRANIQSIQHSESWGWLTSTYQGEIWRAPSARSVRGAEA